MFFFFLLSTSYGGRCLSSMTPLGSIETNNRIRDNEVAYLLINVLSKGCHFDIFTISFPLTLSFTLWSFFHRHQYWVLVLKDTHKVICLTISTWNAFCWVSQWSCSVMSLSIQKLAKPFSCGGLSSEQPLCRNPCVLLLYILTLS